MNECYTNLLDELLTVVHRRHGLIQLLNVGEQIKAENT